MASDKALIKDILSRNVELLIPVYQRRYKWTEKECRKLLNDLKNAEEKKVEQYFLGTLIYVHNGKENSKRLKEYFIVDGQQRMTTFILLYMALYEIFHEKERKNEFTPIHSERLKENYLFNKDNHHNFSRKLMLQPQDDKELEQIYRGEKNNSLLHKNYNYIKNKIKRDDISELLYNILERCVVVEIALRENEDDPQFIFEVINSSGVGLTNGDLVKNLLLMNFNNEEQIHYYKRYWIPMVENMTEKELHDYLSAYINLCLREKMNKKDFYENFRKIPLYGFSIYSPKKGNNEVNQVYDISVNNVMVLEELHKYHSLYVDLTKGRHSNRMIENMLKKIVLFENIIIYPFILKALIDFENNKLNEEKIVKILHFIHSYIVRRFLCNIAPEGLNYTFATILNHVTTEGQVIDYNKVKVFFKTRGVTASYPSNEQILRTIYKPIYNSGGNKKKLIKHILMEIENHINESEVLNEDLTIEHIMPQSLTDKWKLDLGSNHQEVHEEFLHCLPNLSLTGFNSQLGNKSFKQKKEHSEGFNNSILALNKKISEYEKWDKESIVRHGDFLVQIICEIWRDL